MHQQFANAFYGSRQWKECRKAYRQMRGGLCEACAVRGLIVPGTEVHHKRPLTPENINDPRVTLDWGNLELLCQACHESRHQQGNTQPRTDSTGHVDL